MKKDGINKDKNRRKQIRKQANRIKANKNPSAGSLG